MATISDPQVLGVFLVCSALNGPRFFWFKVALKHRADLPRDCPPVYQICPYLQAWSGAKALTWIYSTILNFLPLCLLMAFNGFLIYSVKARRRLRPTLGVADTSDTVWSSEQTRFTLTVIAIVGLFIVLVMPSAFSDTNILFPLLGVTHMTEAVHVFQYISNFLMWLNMSINFLLYTAINIRFQEAFKAMYRKWLVCLRCCKPGDHKHHRHHYKNGMKPRPMLSLPCNGTGDQFASHRPVIRFRQEGQTSNGLPKRAADEEASCGRKFRMFRALVPFTRRSRRWRKSETKEESFPLRPSVRSCSTGTSGSSSQSPTEATEICPMLAMTLTIPPKIQEADSLTLATATPMTPLNEVISPDDVFPPTPERTTCPTFQTLGTSGGDDAMDVGALSPDRDQSDHTIEVNHNNPDTLKVHVASSQNPGSVLEFGSTDSVTEGGAL
ncbi:peptide receptor gpcr [Plakobranchus ocellatus]|uniref:Peptide receptor gpcr n=1 Tax=Plakobranchus ocellatus TaxID=259542 RepID=A0AAV3XX02_9GAST|nr:peptide receptor gpcr [Plakobranchus ocellatus]